VECVEKRILPFEHVSKERFRHSGSISSHAQTFQEACREASAEQLEDDDGLPSMDDVFSHLATLPPAPNSPSQKDTVCHKMYAQQKDVSFFLNCHTKEPFTPPKNYLHLGIFLGSWDHIGRRQISNMSRIQGENFSRRVPIAD
jgi:hypothetical protein